MKIEIWSDIVCPFCYIGKRKFEQALQQFSQKDNVQIEWRSFQLQPDAKPSPGLSIHDHLAAVKGLSPDHARQMGNQVAHAAKEVGLDFDFDKTVVANTWDGHRLLHLAKKHNLQDQAEERLFRAYFTEGSDLNDHDTLTRLGLEIGLDQEEVKQVLASGAYEKEVQEEVEEAQHLGIRGVPFFVINRKYGISGAQPSEVFLQTLQKVWEEEQPTSTALA